MHPPVHRPVLALSLLALLACGEGKRDDDCPEGTAGCTCAADLTCEEGLQCVEGICGGELTLSLRVPEAARACDVLVRESAGQLRSARFGDGAVGTFARRAPRVAVSFVAAADAPIGAGDVQLLAFGGDDALELVSSRCSDVDGLPLQDAEVELSR